ncbi:MAG: hypothetical protein ACR2P4_01900 [Gammaproteobacteria bacterium]
MGDILTCFWRHWGYSGVIPAKKSPVIPAKAGISQTIGAKAAGFGENGVLGESCANIVIALSL